MPSLQNPDHSYEALTRYVQDRTNAVWNASHPYYGTVHISLYHGTNGVAFNACRKPSHNNGGYMSILTPDINDIQACSEFIGEYVG